MMFIELAAARGIVAALGYYDLIGLSTFAVNLLTTLAIAAGTDYAIFLFGRYHEARRQRRGSRNRLLHDVSRHRPRHIGIGSDHRGCDVLPALHEAAVLPNAGHSAGDRHARRGGCGADNGARLVDHLQSLRPVRSEAGDEDSRLAPSGHRRRALAWTDSRRVGGSRAGRSAGASVVQAELQRPPLPALGHPGQSRATRRPTGTSRRPG